MWKRYRYFTLCGLIFLLVTASVFGLVQSGIFRADYTVNKLNTALQAGLDEQTSVIVPYGRYAYIASLGEIDGRAYLAIKGKADSKDDGIFSSAAAEDGEACAEDGIYVLERQEAGTQESLVLPVAFDYVCGQAGRAVLLQTQTGYTLVDLSDLEVRDLAAWGIDMNDEVSLSPDGKQMTVFHANPDVVAEENETEESDSSDCLCRLFDLQGNVLYEAEQRFTLTGAANIAVLGEKPEMAESRTRTDESGTSYQVELFTAEQPQRFIDMRTGKTLFTLPKDDFYLSTEGPYFLIGSLIAPEAYEGQAQEVDGPLWNNLYFYLLDTQGKLAMDGQLVKQAHWQAGRLVAEVFAGSRIDAPDAVAKWPLEPTEVRVYDVAGKLLYTAPEGNLLAMCSGDMLGLMRPDRLFDYVQINEQGKAAILWQGQDMLCEMDTEDGTVLAHALPEGDSSWDWNSALLDSWMNAIVYSAGASDFRDLYAEVTPEGLKRRGEAVFSNAQPSVCGYAVVQEKDECAVLDLQERG